MNIFKKIKRKSELIAIDRMERSLFTSKTGKKEKSLILLKLDAIGDYILFRNFLEELRNSKPGWEIILCGNILWKDLAEKFDSSFVDKFIWVKSNELDQVEYRKSVYEQLRATGATLLIHPTYSRTGNSDKVALASGAQEIIGYDGDTVNIGQEPKTKHNAYYTLLIPSSQEEMHEFDRYKHFFEKVLDKKIALNRPMIKVSQEGKKDSIVIFPGAGHEVKRWPVDHFRKLCSMLYTEYKLPFIIGGSKGDLPIAEELIKNADFPFEIAAGKKSLTDIPELTARAALVIANDSGPFHIAAALQAPSVCIFKGNHFGRFCPYPPEASKDLLFIYPEESKNNLLDPVKRKIMYFEGLEVNLNSIKPETVFEQIKTTGLLRK